MLIKAKGRGRWQSGVPTHQSAQVCSSFIVSEFFLEPKLKYLVRRAGYPMLP